MGPANIGLLSNTYFENPCVGGSIPPQATSFNAPHHPLRVLGRFYILNRISDADDAITQVIDAFIGLPDRGLVHGVQRQKGAL